MLDATSGPAQPKRSQRVRPPLHADRWDSLASWPCGCFCLCTTPGRAALRQAPCFLSSPKYVHPAGWPPGWPSPGLVCQARRGARPHGGLSLSTSLILLCDSVVSGGCCSGLNPANNAAPKHARWSLLVVSLFSPAFACRKSAAPSSLWSLWRCGRLVSPRPRQR